MTTLNKTFLAAALLSALGTACAADVAIYGRIDTGLIFNHNAGDSETAGNTLSLNSGTHSNALGAARQRRPHGRHQGDLPTRKPL